jgi:hypothetical protein
MTPDIRTARQDRWRIAACAVLLVLVAAHYLLILTEAPIFYQRVASREVPTLGIGGNSDVSNAIMAAEAERRGLSLEGYALYYLALAFGSAAPFWVAAGLVLWKHGGDWFRWLTALVLFFFPSGAMARIPSVAHPDLSAYINVLSLLWPLFLLFLYLFPDGRAVPRWSRWPVALLMSIHLAAQALAFVAGLPSVARQMPTGALNAFTLVISAEFLLILVCQAYRYARVSGPVERRQTQWFVAALAATIGASIVIDTLTGGQSTFGDAGYWSDLSNLTVVLIPAAITISILRYRLWDIDVIVRRTLVYSVLTGILALAYFGLVLVLQSIVSAVTGESRSALVTVLSTLAIAALFVPLRARVQRAIDRRFYRKKYDAARTLAAFGAQARDVVELEQLQAQLVSVVDETMQPAHVGLWVHGATPSPRPAPPERGSGGNAVHQ